MRSHNSRVEMAMKGVVARVRTGVLKAWLLSKGIDLRGCVERRDLEDEAKKLMRRVYKEQVNFDDLL